jgi:D-3-phosphoglycerate dehydrogenase / 2-oxoglutarate reductase
MRVPAVCKNLGYRIAGPNVNWNRVAFESRRLGRRPARQKVKSERCGAADALMVQWAPITRRVLEALPNVKGVVRYGIGVDNIDLRAAREAGRMVSNVPNYCQEEIVDHTMAMMISLARRTPQDHSQIVNGSWGIGPFLPVPAFPTLR